MSLTAQADLDVMLAGQANALPLDQPKPSISVIGLGYVGAVSMACLAHLGFRMVGVDISRIVRLCSSNRCSSRTFSVISTINSSPPMIFPF